MGVPKFYRWISERYPKINQVITDSALLPEFDHLYLDMNGIIHGCTHPSHLDVSDVLSERDMMLGIMHYLDRIITQIVKPKVSVFMAIDGVAPRAKLNQQRSRRFRSAKDLAEATKGKAAFSTADESAGAPHGGAFDSNCITPGTEFMARVSTAIKYFIRKKIKEDPLWRSLKIIFSGHELPGEGEHKIMEHIRAMRSQPGYQPNTRHCMYGQDADLIMLGLVSHEPHFTLLREIVDFRGGFEKNKNTLKTVMKFTKESDFQLLHLSVLREYLQIEFAYGLDERSYDLEALIDDFVFMTFLVGNDFLPHMPSLDIGDGAFDLLFNTYREQRPTWGVGQYLTHAGEIADPVRLEAFFAVIGTAETEIFELREENEAIYLKKRRKWDKRDGKPEGPSDAQLAAAEASKQADYLTTIEAIMAKHSADGNFVDGWTPVTDPGKKDFKGRYYFEKLQLTPVDIEQHLALRKSYIEGLVWCLAYYYRGCISWGWFYPYHYGPLLSDLTDLPHIFANIEFELGAPLKPFEQLMGCLPPASSILVPRPYRKLMCSPDSPIIQFYPEDFEVDMNGKRNPWEGVNILPFIDVELLKRSISSLCPDKVLTTDERSRNSVGKVLCYAYDPTVNETIPSCNRDIGLPDIIKCKSRVDVLDELDTTNISFKPELVPGTKIPYPGFPSLNVLPIEMTELTSIGLNCFGSPSKYPTMVLTLRKTPQLPSATVLADNILGKSLFVNWPMMHEAKVVAVSDESSEVRTVKKKKKIRRFTPEEASRWQSDSTTMMQQYLSGSGVPGSGGVIVGDIQIRIKVVPLQGMRTSPANGSTKKLFGKEEADVPLQMALLQAPAADPRFIERGPMTLKDRFPPKCNVILTRGKFKGCTGTVLGIVGGEKVGVRVAVIPPEPPFGLAIARSVQESYISSYDAAKVLQMQPGIFGKVTGSLHFDPGRYDLGLNLKYKQDLCVLGYTRRRKDSTTGKGGKKGKNVSAWDTGDSLLVVGSKRAGESADDDTDEKGEQGKIIWEYTPKAVRLVAAYKQKFPRLFAAISKYPNERFYDAKKIFGSKGEEMLKNIREWLDDVETAKIPRMPSSTEAMTLAAVAAVQRAADVRQAAQEKEGLPKEANIKIPPSALYREGSTSATDVLLASDNSDNPAPELGDRIANLCANGIPFGARGTVVSIHDAVSGCVEVVMDEEFIGGSTLQGACSNFRGKLCLWAHLLKISAADSKGVVDQLIPVGAGKAALDKVLDSNETSESAGKEQKEIVAGPIRSSWDSQVDSANTKESNGPSPNDDAENVQFPAQPSIQQRASTPSKIFGVRAGPSSGGRGGRQGAWKEAKGPDERGIGFKGAGRGKASGLSRWRLLNSCGPTGTARNPVQANSTASTAAGLKAMLGVKKGSEAPNTVAQTVPPEKANASAGLKALLGVGASTAAPSQTALPPPPPPPTRPATAADALLEMMMKNPQVTPPAPVVPVQQPSRPAFNFTYVREGKEPPAPAPAQLQAQPMPMQYHQGMVPAPYMGVPPNAGAAPPSIAMSMSGMGVPVGYPAMPNNAAPNPVVKREKKAKNDAASGVGEGKIIPSVVVSKAKK